MNEKDRQALMRTRAQAILVKRLGEQLREEGMDGVHSVRLDGMPRGKGGVRGGLDARMARREAAEVIAAKESACLRDYEKQARRAMDTMKPEHYAFSALYYIAALPIDEVARLIDRGERQCLRYKREIERGEEEHRKEGA